MVQCDVIGPADGPNKQMLNINYICKEFIEKEAKILK